MTTLTTERLQELIAWLREMISYQEDCLFRDCEECARDRKLRDSALALSRLILAEAELAAISDSGLESALEWLVRRCNNDELLANEDEVIRAESALELLYRSRRAAQQEQQP